MNVLLPIIGSQTYLFQCIPHTSRVESAVVADTKNALAVALLNAIVWVFALGLFVSLYRGRKLEKALRRGEKLKEVSHIVGNKSYVARS
jgi:hypothetical protein